MSLCSLIYFVRGVGEVLERRRCFTRIYRKQTLFELQKASGHIKVYAKENGVWPFTVVGRPPQEDTSFGDIIHEMTGGAVKAEIPGVKEVHAVDAASLKVPSFSDG